MSKPSLVLSPDQSTEQTNKQLNSIVSTNDTLVADTAPKGIDTQELTDASSDQHTACIAKDGAINVTETNTTSEPLFDVTDVTHILTDCGCSERVASHLSNPLTKDESFSKSDSETPHISFVKYNQLMSEECLFHSHLNVRDGFLHRNSDTNPDSSSEGNPVSSDDSGSEIDCQLPSHTFTGAYRCVSSPSSTSQSSCSTLPIEIAETMETIAEESEDVIHDAILSGSSDDNDDNDHAEEDGDAEVFFHAPWHLDDNYSRYILTNDNVENIVNSLMGDFDLDTPTASLSEVSLEMSQKEKRKICEVEFLQPGCSDDDLVVLRKRAKLAGLQYDPTMEISKIIWIPLEVSSNKSNIKKSNTIKYKRMRLLRL